MADPFLGEIRIFSFQFPPRNWATCDGQLLPINQNQALFSLLGTTYGGNGQTTFALPDNRGCTPISAGGHTLGERGGAQSVTLTNSQMPIHNHVLLASSAPASAVIPNNSLVLAQSAFEIYGPPSSLQTMIAGTVSNVGGSQAHENMQPFLTLSFCIALTGIFPSPN